MRFFGRECIRSCSVTTEDREVSKMLSAIHGFGFWRDSEKGDEQVLFQ